MSHLTFSPLIGWPWLSALTAVAIITNAIALRAGVRGCGLRLAGFALLLVTLSGPEWSKNSVTPLPDIAIILVDHSGSMDIHGRNALAADALAKLRTSAGATILDIVDVPPANAGGTSFAPALNQALANIQPDQLSGIVAITDGEVDPGPMPQKVPFTALLTATNEETDRELRLLNAPAFGLVGRPQNLTLEVLDHGAEDTGSTVEVTIGEDGKTVTTAQMTIGQPQTLTLPITHAGAIVVTASVPALPGEVSPINNAAAFTLTGIHRRLTVLLISGSPDQGERAWRLLLKSDSAVQLVHFTILRTPGEAIDADPQNLALVPFPVRQLFETDIKKFDLIILDGFDAAGLLPADYLGNIASFVRHGGALLTEVGPEFAGPDSLALSPLATVLPVVPAPPGTITKNFIPTITASGSRHPVTSAFSAAALPSWFRMEAATPTVGDVLMTGPNNLPLLVLAAAGKGRSGMLLSDQLWLWTRGGSHEGPALPLLRRMVHWLLREPDLEAEALTAAVSGGRLTIERQTLSPGDPGDAQITAPNGTQTRLRMAQTSPGRFTASFLPAKPMTGVYQITEAGLIAYAASSPENTEEFEDLAATGKILEPVSKQLIWLGRTPAVQLAPLLTRRHAVRITAASQTPLLPLLPDLLVSLCLIIAAWWRENGSPS
jgi:hypothetical protein